MKLSITCIFFKRLITVFALIIGINTNLSAYKVLNCENSELTLYSFNSSALALTAQFDTASQGFKYFFTDLSTGATTWHWDFGDGTTSTLQHPNHIYMSNGSKQVCLTVGDASGITESVCYILNVNASEFINVPNVFTPNNDGINDQFYIDNSGVNDFQLEIFDRWGIKVFESKLETIKWDGRTTSGIDLSEGTYYYILNATSVLGTVYNSKGSLSLIRN